MGFFDNIGKTISDVSQSTLKKGKDVAAITKLNSQVNDEKRKIAELIKRLGEDYYRLHSEKPEPELEGYIREIQQCENTINTIQDEINKIKGLEICPFCGKAIEPTTSFCPSCGNKIERVYPQPAYGAPAASSFCQVCGKPLDPGTMFCTNCGTKVAQPEPAPQWGNPQPYNQQAYAPYETQAPQSFNSQTFNQQAFNEQPEPAPITYNVHRYKEEPYAQAHPQPSNAAYSFEQPAAQSEPQPAPQPEPSFFAESEGVKVESKVIEGQAQMSTDDDL